MVSDWQQQIDMEIDMALDELFTRVDHIGLLADVSSADLVEYLTMHYGDMGDNFDDWIADGEAPTENL